MHSCNQILPWERPSPADHLPATRPLHLCYVTHSLSISFLLSAYLFPLFFYSSSFKQQLTTTDKRRVSIAVEQQTNSTNRQTQCDAMQRTESKPLKGCPSPGPKPFTPWHISKFHRSPSPNKSYSATHRWWHHKTASRDHLTLKFANNCVLFFLQRRQTMKKWETLKYIPSFLLFSLSSIWVKKLKKSQMQLWKAIIIIIIVKCILIVRLKLVASIIGVIVDCISNVV